MTVRLITYVADTTAGMVYFRDEFGDVRAFAQDMDIQNEIVCFRVNGKIFGTSGDNTQIGDNSDIRVFQAVSDFFGRNAEIADEVFFSVAEWEDANMADEENGIRRFDALKAFFLNSDI